MMSGYFFVILVVFFAQFCALMPHFLFSSKEYGEVDALACHKCQMNAMIELGSGMFSPFFLLLHHMVAFRDKQFLYHMTTNTTDELIEP